MIMNTKELKKFRKAVIQAKNKQDMEEYWNKVAIKEEGYVEARAMEIEYVRIGKKDKVDEKVKVKKLSIVLENVSL